MPHDLPPWGTVWWHFRNWRDDGTWEAVEETLRARVREGAGREATPSAAIIDSQSVKTAEKGAQRLRRGQDSNRTQATHRGGHREFAAGRGGSSRQHSGSGRRQVGAGQVAGQLLQVAVDLGLCWLRRSTGGLGLGGGRMAADRGEAQAQQPPLEVVPRRWVVEQTLTWPTRCRRLSKDYAERTLSSEAWAYIAIVHLSLKRLQPA